jgi:hypothetical protein
MMIYNALRFASLYLSTAQIREVEQFYRRQFPPETSMAARWLRQSDVAGRRSRLEARLLHDFEWFSERFVVIGLRALR